MYWGNRTFDKKLASIAVDVIRRKEMGPDLNHLDAHGINTEEGIGYTGSMEKYIRALQRYYKNHKENRASVERLFAAHDTEGFMIKVHALKSNSRMIGADEAADAFEKLESAAKDGDLAYIEENTSAALCRYDEAVEAISPVGEMEEIRISGELSADEAKETAEKLLEALEEFDDDLSAELVVRLKGYPFRPTQKGKVDEAGEYIHAFLYDEALSLIKEVIPAIE